MVRVAMGRVGRPREAAVPLLTGNSDAAYPGSGQSLQLTNARASVGSFIDPFGIVQTAGNNVIRFNNRKYVATNYVRNPRMLGARPGLISGTGLLPTFHSVFTNGGLTTEVIQSGVDSAGLPFIDIRYQGVATSAFYVGVFDSTAIPVVASQVVSTAVGVSLVGGTADGIASYAVGNRQVGGAGTVTSTAIALSPRTIRDMNVLTTTVSATGVFPAYLLNLVVGATVDAIIRMTAPDFEFGTGNPAITLPPVGTTGISNLWVGNRMLVEELRTNLTTAYALPTNNAVTPVAANDPNESPNARNMVPNAALSGHYSEATVSVAANVTIAYSVYLRAGNSTKARLNIFGTGNATLFADFTLTGVGSVTAVGVSAEYTTGGGTTVGAFITPFGPNWYRCSIIGIPDTAAITRLCRITLYDPTNTTTTFSGDAVATAITFAWNQIEVGSTVTSYIPTPAGSVTRQPDNISTPLTTINHLAGPTVTNLSKFSETFDTTVWSGLTPTNVIINSPQNVANARQYTVDNLSLQFTYQVHPVLPNTQYTFSVWVQLGTLAASEYTMAFRDDSNNVFIASDMLFPVTTAWSRQRYTIITPANCFLLRVNAFRKQPITGGTFNLWGAQLVIGSDPQQYVPTVATAVTQVVPKNGTSVIRFVPNMQSTDLQGILSLDGGSFSNRLVMYINQNSNTVIVLHFYAGVNTLFNGVGNINFDQENVIALAYTATDIRVSINGGAVVTFSGSLNLAALTTLYVGSLGIGGSPINAGFSDIKHYPVVLPDNLLRAVSTV